MKPSETSMKNMSVISSTGSAYETVRQKQEHFFQSGKTQSLEFRIESLEKLEKALIDWTPKIEKALFADLGKNPTECFISEIKPVLDEIRLFKNNLYQWVKPKKHKTPLILQPATSWTYPTALGQVLIIGPWNYPFQLILAPLVGAIGGGNTVVIKPSEFALHCETLICELIKKHFAEEHVAIFPGGAKTSSFLVEQGWNHIFFTGSTQVGRIIAEAAGRTLTPVTLELGGKSPCIIDSSAKLDYAARRIVFGKFLNAGQTCIAPDYLIVHKTIKNDLIEKIKFYITKFYGEQSKQSDSYGRIISEIHIQRLKRLLDGEKIIFGGEINIHERYLQPTLVDEPSLEAPLMREEIFGPILPMISYEKRAEVITIVKENPSPLAFYLFTENQKEWESIIAQTPFGGGIINDTLIHRVNPYVPFGGVGKSGMGRYNGYYSFKTFTHEKTILKQSNLFDLPLRYPPFTKLLKKVMTWL